MTDWLYYDTNYNTGQFNMNFDLSLCEKSGADNIPVLRFYQWKPYCLSIGYNQKDDTLNKELLAKDNIDIVKRPTGGRAVLHAEELTYSVSVSPSVIPALALYHEVSKSIIKGFHLYSDKLKGIELEKNQVDFSEFYKSHRSIPCFSSSARYEIKYNEKKIVGSAQRAFNNSVLQHGSILCGEFHKNLYKYIGLKEEEVEQLKADLEQKTITLEAILQENIDYPKLKSCIKKGFETNFNINFSEQK